MRRARLLFACGSVATPLMVAAAIWFIVTSPGRIDEVPPYTAPSASPGDPVAVSVLAGQPAKDIGEQLEAKGVIDSARRFEVLVALMGYNAALQAGGYEFEAGSPVLKVIYRMRRGILSTRSVTVLEGWRTEEIADEVARQGISREDFLAAARSRDYEFDFLAEIPPDRGLEGFLYPATYSIRAVDDPRDVVRQMLQAFQDNVPQGLRESAAASDMTFYQVVTLASIIEREAVIPDERPVMAQVFRTRLAYGMLLQADPTVQYALASEDPDAGPGGYWKRDLTESDLAVDSAYNTYLHPGLPAGPICNPSLDSIIAVLQPADTQYLYFVARPDGSHAFAETLAEHQENVEKYAP